MKRFVATFNVNEQAPTARIAQRPETFTNIFGYQPKERRRSESKDSSLLLMLSDLGKNVWVMRTSLH